MLEFERNHVHVCAQVVTVAKAVVVVARDRRRTIEVPGNAVVGNIIFVEMEIARGEPVRRAHSESERRRHTKTAILRNVAFGHIGFIAHQVESKCVSVVGISKRLVDVSSEAPGEVGTEVALDDDESIGLRATCFPG